MVSPSRICFVITRADAVGGAQIHVRDLATELHRRGYEIHVVSGSRGALSTELSKTGVPFHCIPHLQRALNPKSDIRAVLELRGVLHILKPDIVSTHSSKAGVIGRIAARTLGVPVVFTAHGWSFGPGRPQPQSTLYRLAERLVAPFSSKIITVSEADRILAIASRVAAPDRVVTIHNAMPDISRSLKADPARQPPSMVMVARFAPQKDHRTLIRALAKLKDKDWAMTLVGEGDRLGPMQSLSRDLGLAERITFSGFRHDVSKVLAAHQVFILASNFEGLPRSVIEAMRAGLPVVASDVGGIHELVRSETTGFIVPPADDETLARRIADLIDDPSLRVRMGRAGRQQYEMMFTFERLLDETLAVYREILAR